MFELRIRIFELQMPYHLIMLLCIVNCILVGMVNLEVFKGVSWQSIHFKKVKYHKRESSVTGITKIIDHIRPSVPMTFDHLLWNIGEKSMLGSLKRVLQIYMEYWNSHVPPTEHLPNFTKTSITTCQECEYIKLCLFSDSENVEPIIPLVYGFPKNTNIT